MANGVHHVPSLSPGHPAWPEVIWQVAEEVPRLSTRPQGELRRWLEPRAAKLRLLNPFDHEAYHLTDQHQVGEGLIVGLDPMRLLLGGEVEVPVAQGFYRFSAHEANGDGADRFQAPVINLPKHQVLQAVLRVSGDLRVQGPNRSVGVTKSVISPASSRLSLCGVF